MTRNIIAIALAAACLPAAAPAAAEDGARIAVKTAGLDLSSAEGRRALASRANAASYGVCGPVLTYHRSHEAIAEGCRAEIRARVKAAAMRRALAPSYQVASR
jgi:UrcA family protein